MSTTIQFLNSNNKLISEQQANQLNRFSKNTFIDGILKKEEDYYENKLRGGIYHLSPGENVIEILSSIGVGLNWAIVSNKQIINNYITQEVRWYDDILQIKSQYAKEVTDNLGNHIATVHFDTVTNQPKGAFKVFNYGNQQIPWGDPGDLFPEDSEISFLFSDDGSIENIKMNYNIINNDSYWRRLDKFLTDAGDMLEEIGFTQEKLYYFTHVEPVVPNF